MSDAAVLGIPRDFVFRGQTYKVSIRDFFTELAFADWVGAEAGLFLGRMRARWPAIIYQEQSKILNGKLASKGFSWGAEDVHQAYWSDAGRRQMLFLKMQRGAELEGGEPLTRDLIDEIAKDAAKWSELVDILWQQDEPDFFADLQKERAMTAAPPSANPSNAPPDSTPKA
jgi:hypothetical protein